jgi:hypothetical protein
MFRAGKLHLASARDGRSSVEEFVEYADRLRVEYDELNKKAEPYSVSGRAIKKALKVSASELLEVTPTRPHE